MLRAGLALSAFALSVFAGSAQAASLDPTIEKIVHDVSQGRIADTMKKLTSFQTRGNFTDPEQQNRGIGAARRLRSVALCGVKAGRIRCRCDRAP